MANHGHHSLDLCLHRFSFSSLLRSFFPTGGDSFLFFVGGFLLLQLICDSFCLPKFCGSNFHRKPPWLQTSKSLLFSFLFPLFAHWVVLLLLVKAMVETLRQPVQDLSLGSDDDYIALPPEFCPRTASVTRFSFVVTPVNTRKQNLRALIGQMPTVWGLTGSCIGRLIGNGRVQFTFQIEESMNLVLPQGIWSFNDWMLYVHRWYPNIGDDEMKIIPFWVQIQDEIYVSDLSVSNRKIEQSIKLNWMFRREANYKIIGKLLLGLRLREFFALMEFTQVCLVAINIIQTARSLSAAFGKDTMSNLVMFSFPVYDSIDRDHLAWMMDFWLYQFGLCWFELSSLHVVLVNYWRHGFVGIAQIGRLETTLATLGWVLLYKRGSGIWDDMVISLVVMLKRITQSQYLKETLVRKCWCHYVYISDLVSDTSVLMLRFVKRSHSHKLLYTIRNKEESNMKLDNNRSFDRLASKATLRKASSNSLLLYFLLVYGTYICVCNNCVLLILYVSVITLLD